MGEYIVNAAIRFEGGALFCGSSHPEILFAAHSALKQGHHECGFITNFERFVSRAEGAKIAKAAGQLAWPFSAIDLLYSEDLR